MASDVTATEDLSLEQAAAEAAELTERILEARDAYYDRDAAIYSDADYDGFMRRLEELERLFPELQGQDSPTQSVGGRAETTLPRRVPISAEMTRPCSRSVASS